MLSTKGLVFLLLVASVDCLDQPLQSMLKTVCSYLLPCDQVYRCLGTGPAVRDQLSVCCRLLRQQVTLDKGCSRSSGQFEVRAKSSDPSEVKRKPSQIKSHRRLRRYFDQQIPWATSPAPGRTPSRQVVITKPHQVRIDHSNLLTPAYFSRNWLPLRYIVRRQSFDERDKIDPPTSSGRHAVREPPTSTATFWLQRKRSFSSSTSPDTASRNGYDTGIASSGKPSRRELVVSENLLEDGGTARNLNINSVNSSSAHGSSAKGSSGGGSSKTDLGSTWKDASKRLSTDAPPAPVEVPNRWAKYFLGKRVASATETKY